MEADRFREILDLLEASLDEPQLAGDELAGRAYLSRYYFDRLVRSVLDEPLGSRSSSSPSEPGKADLRRSRAPLPGPTASPRPRSGPLADGTTACLPRTRSTSCPQAASGCPPQEQEGVTKCPR
jgi:hypothetical protein